MDEVPRGTDILKLFDELRKGESLLAVQLITGTNGRDTFLLQTRVPFISPPSPTESKDSKQQSTSFSFALGNLLCDRS